MDVLSPTEVAGHHLPDWRVLPGVLTTIVETGSMVTGVEFTTRVLQVAEERNHHPDITLSYPRLLISLTSHDAGGITERDVDLAQAITTIAEEMELTLAPAAVSALQIVIDALEVDDIRPFWRAILGYADGPAEGTLADPLGIGPLVRFQRMEAPRRQRHRLHLELYVPDDRGRERVDAALTAGGTLLDGAAAPSSWLLADAEGNEARLRTCRQKKSTG